MLAVIGFDLDCIVPVDDGDGRPSVGTGVPN
jgi:hypothetical protein